MPTPVKGEAQLFAVICKWADRRGPVLKDEGHLAIIVEGADANEAELAANVMRPDLWEADGYTRHISVHPAIQLQKDTKDKEATNADAR